MAKELLGKYLVRRIGKKIIARMITEVEAYDGPLDRASHAYRGKTPRNRVMFGKAGQWYVYLCYGIHQMLNITTGPEGYPAAILIRSIALENTHSNILQNVRMLINGPGKVTKSLRIDGSLNAKPCSLSSGLWIEDRGMMIPKQTIKKSSRIGVAYAGKLWAGKKYRFYIHPHSI